jgi:class 3 adenylate cyclase
MSALAVKMKSENGSKQQGSDPINHSGIPEDALACLRDAARAVGTPGLKRLWLREPEMIGRLAPAVIEEQVSKALSEEGDFLGAYDLATEGVRLARACGYPTEGLELARATALARAGSPRLAREVLDRLLDGGVGSALANGAVARTLRDVARACATAQDKRAAFREAADWAERGWQSAPAHDTIDALLERAYLAGQVAQFRLIGGDPNGSREFRGHVAECCCRAEALAPGPEGRFWVATNRAEMALLEGQTGLAAGHYREMRETRPHAFGHIAANASVCRMLLEELGHPANLLDPCFVLPPVVLFSGHGFDPPGRPVDRLTESEAAILKARIRKILDEHEIQDGFVSASAGSDLLFGEALLERGGRLHLVLPFDAVTARRLWVETHDGIWAERFDRVLHGAVEVSEPGTAVESDISPAHFQYRNRILAGLVLLAARRVGIGVQPLLMLDSSQSGDTPPGGTGDMARFLDFLGLQPWILRPTGSQDDWTTHAPDESGMPWRAVEDPPGRVVRSFLFADLIGSSRISEERIAAIIQRFLGVAAKVLDAPDCQVLACNTWGDALYAVFADESEAAAAALRLRDGVAEIATAAGKSREERLRIRISLHAGPARRIYDPVIRQDSYAGGHVVRAARMEPLAEAGQVIVSEEFAALLATGRSRDRFLICYLGQARLPKGFGRVPAYELEWGSKS